MAGSPARMEEARRNASSNAPLPQPGTAQAFGGFCVTGNTYPFRERLKAAGFEWDSQRKAWFMGDPTWAKIAFAEELSIEHDQAVNGRYACWQAKYPTVQDQSGKNPWDEEWAAAFPAAFLRFGYFE